MTELLRTLRFTHSYPFRYRGPMILAQLIMLISMLTAIAIPLMLLELIDGGVLRHDWRILLGSSVLVLVVGAIAIGLLYLGKRIRFTVSGHAVSALRHDLLEHLMKLGPAETADATGGQALARLSADAAGLRAVVNGGFVEIVNQGLMALALLVVCLVLDWKVTLLALIPLVPSTALTLRVQLRLQKVFTEIRAHFSALLAGVVESLANAGAVKALGREAHTADGLNDINAAMARRRRHLRMTSSTYTAIFNVIGALPVPIVLWFGTRSVLQGGLSVGALVALIALIMMFQMTVHMVVMDINGALHSVVVGGRLRRLMEAPPALDLGEGCGEAVPQLTGRISAHGVRAQIADRLVLDHVDLSVAPGEFVALLGPTGGGKSVLLHVLARLRDPSAGQVRYDDRDARQFDPVALRRQIICLPQRQWIFEGSLADNVAWVRPGATGEQIARAVGRAGIGHIPLDRRLAAGSVDLSAGERQRVGLARALLVDPPILLLDNPTANLDGETEVHFVDTLLALRGTRTLIVATSQMSVARHADRILVLDGGLITGAQDRAAGAADFMAELRAMDLAAAGLDRSGSHG